MTEAATEKSLAEAEKAFDEQVRRDLPRNYAVNLVHGLLGQTGFRLVHAPTFVPAFIYILSGSELAVGLALAGQHFGAASSSLLGATLIEHRKKVIPIGFVIGGLMRPTKTNLLRQNAAQPGPGPQPAQTPTGCR